ncbi:hypothetical protein AB0J86_27360 [Micromonospora sp. NPDC049559]|uniref:hypothetical protein n=1 Tax=Micromonospora sp. NPDC049559 TaxID=3155923 RepID=UPI00342A258C
MYLIHALLSGDGHAALPPDTAALVMQSAQPEDGLQHVVVHADASPGPVLGLLLLAPSLESSELAAQTIIRRALQTHDSLRGYTLVSCGAAMPAPYYNRLLEH